MQSKRTDLGRKKVKEENETYVQSRQNLNKDTKRSTPRDRMAYSPGISPVTFSKYKRIINISDSLDKFKELYVRRKEKDVLSPLSKVSLKK